MFAYDLVKGEESAFPWLFTCGKNGFKQHRKVSLTPSQYFHNRLSYHDGRFRNNITYLLHAVNEYERVRLLSAISIHMRMRKPSSHDNRPVTAGNITHFRENPDLLQNSYMFMKNIRGTAAYWKDTLLNFVHLQDAWTTYTFCHAQCQ